MKYKDCTIKTVSQGLVQICLRRVWRYQRGNQDPEIEGGQTTQWQETEQTTIYKTLQKTKDRVTRTPLKPGVNSGAPEG